jgi:hypothetical protein
MSVSAENIDRAHQVPFERIIERHGFKLRRVGKELIGPCPRCGGTDRFAINLAENIWNCRHCKPGKLSGDPIGFVQWLNGCDFAGAVEYLTGEPMPKRNGGDGPIISPEPPPAEPPPRGSPSRRALQITATYNYRNLDDLLLYQVCRQECVEDGKRKKTFLQRRPFGAIEQDLSKQNWIWGLGEGVFLRGLNSDFYAATKERLDRWRNAERIEVEACPHILYRWPELREELAQEPAERRIIWIAEGERDCDTLAAWNLVATTNSGGAANWRPEHAEELRDADVVILLDNDLAGRKRGHDIALSLQGVASRIRVLSWPDHWPGCPDGGDVTDWRELAGGDVAKLFEIVEKLPDWTEEEDQSHEPGAWWRDPATIPARQFLHDRHYIRGTVSATIAAGGRGKTTRACYEAVSMAAGRDLTTGELLLAGALRVGVLNGEEDQDELDRRLAATCLHYDLAQADLGGRLFAQSVRRNPLRLATMVKNIPTLNVEAVNRLRAFVRDNQLDVLIIDPLVSFHSVPENDNGAMDVLIKDGFGAIAEEMNSAVELCHHPGKPKAGQAETTVEDSRGASAVIWAVRSARVFNFMIPEEAAKLGIPEDQRRLHIRMANGKANMGPLGTAKWMKLVVEVLPNGDEIACSSSWKPPDPFKGVATADMHKCRALAQTGAYRLDSRSSDWVGYMVADVLNVDVAYGAQNDPKDIARIKQILHTWFKNKVLATEQHPDKNRKKRSFVVPGKWDETPTPEEPDLDE